MSRLDASHILCKLFFYITNFRGCNGNSNHYVAFILFFHDAYVHNATLRVHEASDCLWYMQHDARVFNGPSVTFKLLILVLTCLYFFTFEIYGFAAHIFCFQPHATFFYYFFHIVARHFLERHYLQLCAVYLYMQWNLQCVVYCLIILRSLLLYQ